MKYKTITFKKDITGNKEKISPLIGVTFSTGRNIDSLEQIEDKDLLNQFKEWVKNNPYTIIDSTSFYLEKKTKSLFDYYTEKVYMTIEVKYVSLRASFLNIVERFKLIEL